MTAVQHKPNGRIVSVIPKGEALNADLDHGDKLSWHVESRDRLTVRVEPDTTDRPTTTVQYDNSSGSFTVTVPKHVCYSMHFSDGELSWDYKRGTLTAEVESRGGNDQ